MIFHMQPLEISPPPEVLQNQQTMGLLDHMQNGVTNKQGLLYNNYYRY